MGSQVLSGLLGFLTLGTEILLLKAFSSFGGSDTPHLLLPVLFFATAIGTAWTCLSAKALELTRSHGQLILAIAVLVIVFSSPFVSAPTADGAGAPLIGAGGMIGLALIGMIQAGLFIDDPNKIALSASFTVGLLLANSVTISLEYVLPNQTLFFFAAIGFLVMSFAYRPKSPFWRLAILASIIPIGVATKPFAAPDPSYLSNSYSSLHVSQLDDPRRSRNDMGMTEFNARAEPAARIFVINRNNNGQIPFFDVRDERDLATARLEPAPLKTAMNFTRRKEKAALIGTGGGREVLLARQLGFERIQAVEINPLMIEATNRFSRNPALIYEAPNVEAIIADGRRHMEHLPSDQKFDLVTLWSTKVFGTPLNLLFSDNPLLTADSFATMFGRVRDGGLFVFGRHNADASDRPIISAAFRGFLRAAAATDEVAYFKRRRARYTEPLFKIYFLARRGGFSPDERAALKDEMGRHGFTGRFYRPKSLNRATTAKGPKRIPTDDRPFPHAEIMAGSPAIGLAMIASLMAALAAWGTRRSSPNRRLLLLGGLLGFAGLGIQTLAISRMIFGFGLPGFMPTFVMSMFGLFGFIGYWLELRRPSGSVKAHLLFAGVLSLAGLAAASEPYSLPNHAFVPVLITLLISSSALFTARAFAVLLRQLRGGAVGWFLFANGVGMLCGGLLIKVALVYLGYKATLLIAGGALLVSRWDPPPFMDATHP